MPFPSLGCQTCKIRRIKCDEAQPTCERCMKSQRVCYGMKAGKPCFDVVHIENSYASGQQKRPRGPRSSATFPTKEPIGKLDLGLQRPLVDLKTTAVVYYLRYHLQTLDDEQDLTKGVSADFLPTWMSRAECPMLDLAVSSMALSVFARKQKYPPAAIEASIKYQRLLQIVQVTISCLNEGNIDACLLANFFMSRYEQVVHRPSRLDLESPSFSSVQSFSHHDGALTILKIWKTQLSHVQPVTNVIKHTRRAMIKSAFLRGLPLPEWILEGASFGEHGIELEYDRIIIQIASVRQRLSSLLKEKTGSERTSHDIAASAEDLGQEVRRIDEALQHWTSTFPSTWCYHRHTLSDHHQWSTGNFYSRNVYSYSSRSYAAIWNGYYATRMLINSTRLRVLELIPLNLNDIAHEHQRSECLTYIETMADDLASSVPFCLERFTVTDNSPHSSPSHQDEITLNTNKDPKPYVAGQVVWPLSLASSLAYVDVKHRLWFSSELARLGRLTGDRILECSGTFPWFKL